MTRASMSIISTESQGALPRAAAILRDGGLVAFPTDTVYGIGAAHDNPAAVRGVFRLKGRHAEKALPILIADAEQIQLLAVRVSPEARRLVDSFWPGALTLVFDSRDEIIKDLAPGRRTIGVRLPAMAVVRELIRLARTPLACSSANSAGMPPATDAPAVSAYFPSGLDLILDGGPLPNALPSTVVDVTVDGCPRILREGAVTRSALSSCLGYEIGRTDVI